MEKLNMPAKRDFGWELKPVESTKFGIHQKENGQFCVVLNHSLLRDTHLGFREYRTAPLTKTRLKQQTLVNGFGIHHPARFDISPVYGMPRGFPKSLALFTQCGVNFQAQYIP